MRRYRATLRASSIHPIFAIPPITEIACLLLVFTLRYISHPSSSPANLTTRLSLRRSLNLSLSRDGERDDAILRPDDVAFCVTADLSACVPAYGINNTRTPALCEYRESP